jgi:pimeloyl-ACP methyl ester carboxylesterase
MLAMTLGVSADEVKGWPEQVKSVEYLASIDDSQQPMLVYGAKSKGKRPLLVGLHTWSGDYTQAGEEVVYARWCIEKDWHFIHPHFRGPNSNPDACGSEKVVQDIIDAVEYMKRQHNLDTDRIYLVGGSGGGYVSLLMAGRAPDIWAGVSSWVPISDIRAWWEQNDVGKHSKYARDIEKAVGGRPDQSSKAAQECVKRSAITYLQNASAVNLDINAGVTDGHGGGSVPFSHSLYAFNQVVPEKNRIDPQFIQTFYEKQALPAGLEKADADPLYGKKDVVFRNVFLNTRVTIFQGGHEVIHHAALNWLAQQRRGTPANWNVKAVDALKTNGNESESGK